MDELDRAKDLEMAHRQRSLEAQRAAAQEREAPFERDGVRYCLDCGVAIPPARLAARPESVRCIDCKTLKERREKDFRR